MTPDDESLVAELCTIARERLASLEAWVSGAEAGQSAEVHREIARELHTLKGEARIVGLAEVAACVHDAEDAAHSLARAPLDRELRAALHAALDRVEAALPRRIGNLGEGDEGGLVHAEGARVPRARINQLEAVAAALRSGDSARRELCSEVELMRVELRALRRALMQSGGAAALWLHLDRIDRRATTLATQARGVVGETREHIEELEAAARALALVPVEVLFAPQRAALRRMADEQGKQVELVIEGAEVELDRDALDALSVPLLHLVRNALDHGIESPAQRLAAGKAARGRITLSARTDGAEVEIAIRDDGAGIDESAVRDKARALGLDPEGGQGAADLVFVAGLSTRAEVGSTSGRGVGLDVVLGSIREMGGSARAESEWGHGTNVVLRVPAARVVASGALLEASGHTWAIPMRALREALDLSTSRVERAGSGWVLRRTLPADESKEPRTRAIPYAPLDAFLGVSASAAPQRIVVIGRGERELALGVSAFRGVVRMTVRRDTSLLASLPMVSGAALLEDGQAVPLLDVGALLGAETPSATATSSQPAPARRHVLVVDDSELMRDIAASALRAMGHEVSEAMDGRHAIAQLDSCAPDLIVTDLDMPVMDGFALLAHVRAHASLSRLPVVVFTSSESDASMRRAGELGADAYVVKSRLSRTELERAVLGLLRDAPRVGARA